VAVHGEHCMGALAYGGLDLPQRRCLVSQHFDAIIIGTGQAGPSLAARFSAAGMAVAIIERHKFGGTCVNTGCIPTKTLIASAYAAHVARRGAEYGFVVNGDVRVDMKRVKARKNEVAGRSSKGVEEWLRGLKNCRVIHGHARFQSSRTVVVNDEILQADKVFINVGGRAFVPAIPGINDAPFLTNSSMMDVDFLPEHLVIVGGSYVGLEFAQMYRRFGSEVTIVEMGPRLIGREDEDVSEAVSEILQNEGIRIRPNAKCLSLAKRDSRIAVGVKCDEGPPEVLGTHVLLAVGRTPNTTDLGLDRAGVATDQHGYIIVDDQLQTNVPGIWALGDCNGRGAFTHTSYNDYEIVADNLLNAGHRRVSDRIQTYALFIDPPLGRCGMTEAEIRKSGRAALATKHPMSRVSRAVEKGETQGFIKISVDAETKHILGAAILGTGGDEVVHVLLDVMYAKAPYTVVQRAMHIHPTVAEFLPTVLSKLEPFA
jgi:pyruvate/2-oxoglutarate dehydrogenase complex dihydrolipoamide dehydrogenase (E3) component